jgi:hypothetical protein
VGLQCRQSPSAVLPRLTPYTAPTLRRTFSGVTGLRDLETVLPTLVRLLVYGESISNFPFTRNLFAG